jgi:hypothetical protein
MSRTRDLWKVYLAVGVAASLAYHFFPSAKWGLLISAVAAAFAAAAIVIGVRLHRPARTLPWYALAGMPALFCVGYLIAQGYVLVTGVYPVATAADVFWNLGDLSLAVGLVLLLCRRENNRTSLLDVGIIALAVSQIAWVELIMDYAQTNQLSVAVRTTQITYGVLDVLVLALLCRIVVSAGSRRGSFALWSPRAVWRCWRRTQLSIGLPSRPCTPPRRPLTSAGCLRACLSPRRPYILR